jgi:chromosome segregation ATPase
LPADRPPSSPRKPIVTERSVADAIARIERAGENPTNDAIKAVLDGGSFRDIARLRREILAARALKAEADRTVPEIPEDVADALATIWAEAWRAADARGATEREAHRRQIQDREAEIAELHDNLGAVEDERDAAIQAGERRAAQLEAERDAAAKRAGDLEGQLAAERHQVAELRLAIARLEGRLQGRLDATATADPHGAEAQAPVPDAVQG